MVSPATTSIVPAISRIGTDSRRMRMAIGSPDRKAATRAATAITDVTMARIGVTMPGPTMRVARNSDGNVTMSPAAVTSGAATLSRSQSKRTDAAATPMVSRRTNTDEMAPPTIEITMK